MTTQVMSTQTQAFAPYVGRSILLNSSPLPPTSAFSRLTPPMKTSSIISHSSTASSSSLSDDIVSSSDSMPGSARRKIRFAPLPDPRRAVLITEDGDEIPLPDANFGDDDLDDATSNASGSQPSTPNNKYAHAKARFPLQSLQTESTDTLGLDSVDSGQNTETNTIIGTDDGASDHGFTFVSPPASPRKERRSSSPHGHASRWGSKGLLKPLLRLPKASVSTEEILTLGAVNLFKSSSRESVASTQSERQQSARRTSSASEDRKIGGILKGGHSLRPVTSEVGTSTTAKNTKANAASGGGRMKGARMLNGRVYGQKSGSQSGRYDKHSNLFATVRNVEPEFVEWGYGGMGSKLGGSAATDTRGKQTKAGHAASNSSAGSGTLAGKTGGTTVTHEDDDFDGSGMGWVKRRREERERRAREREMQEKEGVGGGEKKADGGKGKEDKDENQQEAVVPVPVSKEIPMPTIQVHSPSPTRESTPTISAPPVQRKSSVGKENIAPTTTATAQDHHGKEADHVYTAVNIPASPWHAKDHHHAHPHSHHHGSPGHSRPDSPLSGLPVTKEAYSKGPSPLSQSHEVEHDHVDVHGAITALDAGVPASPDSTTSASEFGDDDDEDDENKDEDDADTPDSETEDIEDEEQEQKRLTAIGAGVEKISRHKE